MRPEEFILEHARAYDPAARREYYLRTRKLKGRRSATGSEPRSRPTSSEPRPMATVTPIKPAQEAKRRREAAKARVEAMQRRLERLNEVLQQLVEAAKVRSGVEPKADTPDKSEPEKKTEEKPKTEAEKKEAAEDQRERREKETGEPSLSRQEQTLEADLVAVRQKIAEARENLAASVKRARQKVEFDQSNQRRRTAVN